MQGQHIYVRCYDVGGQGATCTAAVTKGIVSDGVIREKIEPLCIIRETFASEWLRVPADGILKVYHPNAGTTVVSRSTWEQDRITDRENGRTGVYTISHILTEEDSVRFVNEFSGAFCVENFQSYDALVQDMRKRDSDKVALDNSYSLFAGAQAKPDYSAFDAIGFTEATFRRFMYLLCEAVSKGTQVRLVLPDEVNQRWKTEGVDMALPFLHALLGILPEYIRCRLNFVSHWGADTDSAAVAGMHLLIVHPKNEEEYDRLAADAARATGNVVMLGERASENVEVKYAEFSDIDSTGYVEDPMAVFGMLWNYRNTGEYKYFYDYTKVLTGTLYSRMLLNSIPTAAVMMSMYTIWQSRAVHATIRDKVSGIVCSLYYVGLINRLPEIERFINEATGDVLEAISSCVSEPENIRILRALELPLTMLLAKRKTPYEFLSTVYKLVSLVIENTGTQESMTLSVMGNELNKEDEEAARWLTSYYEEFEPTSEEDGVLYRIRDGRSGVLTEALLIQHALLRKESLSYEESDLATVLQDAIKCILDIFVDNGDWESLLPIGKHYADYIRGGGKDATMNRVAMEFLVDASAKSGRCRNEYLSLIWKVEKEIYKNTGFVLSDGQKRYHLFAEIACGEFPHSEEYDPTAMGEIYERLCRMSGSGEPAVLEMALRALSAEMEVAPPAGVFSKVLSGLESVSGHFWPASGISLAVGSFAQEALAKTGRVPPEGEMDRVLRLCDINDSGTRLLITKWFLRIEDDRCATLCELLKKHKMHPVFFLMAKFDSTIAQMGYSQTKLDELDRLFVGGRREFWEMMESHRDLLATFNPESLDSGFRKVYKDLLERTIVFASVDEAQFFFESPDQRAKMGPAVQVRALMEENNQVQKLRQSKHALADAARSVMMDFARRKLCAFGNRDILLLPPYELEQVQKMLKSLNVAASSEAMKKVTFVGNLDRVLLEDSKANNGNRGLYNFCTSLRVSAEQGLAAERLLYFIYKKPEFASGDGMFTHTLCMHYVWLDGKRLGTLHSFADFAKLNADYSRLQLADRLRVLMELIKRCNRHEMSRIYREEAGRMLREFPDLKSHPDIKSNATQYLSHAYRPDTDMEFSGLKVICCLIAALVSVLLFGLFTWGVFFVAQLSVAIAIAVEVLLIIIICLGTWLIADSIGN